MVWPVIAGGLLAAAPWLIKGAPAMGRGAKALWGLGRGMGTPAGRAAAGDALVSGTGRASKYVRENPIKSSIGLGAGGLVAGSMFEGDPEEQVPGVTGMPAQIPGYGPQAAPEFTSNLPSYTERAQANRAKFMGSMSTIIKHSMLLSFQNPGRKNSYMKDAIEMIKMGAMQDNEVEVARMIDEVFKDKKVPKTAKTIYKRMIAAGASPKEASEVSDYTLDIEGKEAKAAADYARANDPSKLMSKKEMKWQSILRQAQTDLDGAATTLAQAWAAGTDLKLQDYYAGYETRDFQELKDLALELLGGGARGATQAGGSGILTIDKS